jgi:hypothetical protein
MWGLPFGALVALTSWSMMGEKLATPGHAHGAFFKWLLYWIVIGLVCGLVWAWAFRSLAGLGKRE